MNNNKKGAINLRVEGFKGSIRRKVPRMHWMEKI